MQILDWFYIPSLLEYCNFFVVIILREKFVKLYCMYGKVVATVELVVWLNSHSPSKADSSSTKTKFTRKWEIIAVITYVENNDDDISITLLSQMSSRSSLTFDFSAHHSNFKALSAMTGFWWRDLPWPGAGTHWGRTFF